MCSGCTHLDLTGPVLGGKVGRVCTRGFTSPCEPLQCIIISPQCYTGRTFVARRSEESLLHNWQRLGEEFLSGLLGSSSLGFNARTRRSPHSRNRRQPTRFTSERGRADLAGVSAKALGICLMQGHQAVRDRKHTLTGAGKHHQDLQIVKQPEVSWRPWRRLCTPLPPR